MGIDDNAKRIIQAIAENDIRAARKCALAALDADTTQKNRAFVNRYRAILSSRGTNMIELPPNLRDILNCEDVSMSFKEGRYYAGERERHIFHEISKMARSARRLMELQIPYRNATLLYGPPGTGKTEFGRFTAYKMGLPFCYLNFSRVVDSYMGATSRNIAQAFAYAASNPCVFMLDEVDTISADRGRAKDGTEKEIGRVTVTLMQELDRLPGDVVVIAATNRLDLLDKAFVSRCPLKYEMPPFGEDERLAMACRFLSDTGIELPEEEVDRVAHEARDQRETASLLVQAIAEKLADEEDAACAEGQQEGS